MTRLDDALMLTQHGWPVFPCEADKKPVGSLAPEGFKDATTHQRRVKQWWRVKPDALVGVALLPGTMAVDVDDVALFEATGLLLPDAPEQRTRSGGYHRLYATNGHAVKQSVKKIPGMDTRVGGKGYVIAWDAGAFPDASDLPEAPEWLWTTESEAEEPAETATDDADLLIGSDGATHRPDIITFVGRLRWAGATTNEIYQSLLQAQEDGRIIDGDPARPWTEKDFAQIAKDLGSKPGATKAPVFTVSSVPHQKPPAAVPAKRIFANALLEEEFPELEYVIDEIMPEGLGIISGAPKAGKSWLALQTAIESVSGGSLFGRPVSTRRPVLYFALEDGERRMQSRLRVLIGNRSLDLDLLEVRFEARPMANGFEEDIALWLDANKEYGNGLVIVDVMAKVRSAAKGRDSAYNEDYSSMSPLQSLVRDRPGSSLVVVTHTRKAGAEDFLSTVQGTHGVVGSADWVWAVRRERLQPEGVLNIVGRDVFEQSINVVHTAAGAWVLSGKIDRAAKSDEQEDVRNALLTEGDMVIMEIVAYLYPDVIAADEDPATHSAATFSAVTAKRGSVNDKLLALEKQGLARKAGKDGVANVWHGITQNDVSEAVTNARIRAVAATPSTGLTARALPAGAPAGTRRRRRVPPTSTSSDSSNL